MARSSSTARIATTHAELTQVAVATTRPVARPLGTPTEPFIKWAGGKTRILPELVSRLPPASLWTGRYFEPFLGGAAVYLHLQPNRAVLTDTNAELINLYKVVRDDVESLITNLGRHTYERTHYYAVRALDPTTLDSVERAARFVFLNRTCFNGLYRVNRQGQFNVPFGRYTNPTVCPEDRLRRASQSLAQASIEHGDFDSVLATAKAGDFVYLDPPYVPLTPTANFTSYTADDFGLRDQERLAERFRELSARGVACMLSNSDTPLIAELYRGFRIDRIMAPRAISRDADGRRPVSEVIVRNY